MKKETVVVRTPDGMKEDLQKIADSYDREFSDFVRKVFKDLIKQAKENGRIQ